MDGRHQPPPVLTEQETGWGTGCVTKAGKYERFLSRKGIEPLFLCLSARA